MGAEHGAAALAHVLDDEGLTYSQTVSLSGVTSKKRAERPSQISVLPLGSRWAPLMFML